MLSISHSLVQVWMQEKLVHLYQFASVYIHRQLYVCATQALIQKRKLVWKWHSYRAQSCTAISRGLLVGRSIEQRETIPLQIDSRILHRMAKSFALQGISVCGAGDKARTSDPHLGNILPDLSWLKDSRFGEDAQS